MPTKYAPAFYSYHHINMGIKGLWPKLASASESRLMSELAVAEGYKLGDIYGEGPSMHKIGVDISLWLRQCCATFRHNHHNAGSQPELRIIFYRFARLLGSTVTVIVVYDGNMRPKLKRGKCVKSTPHWMTQSVRQMASLFGFENHTAPGEAEAELARLNSSGRIDSILSDDVDTFLFGGIQVIRNPSVKVSGDEVQVYTASAIWKKTQLTRNKLIVAAVISGGDYDKRGLKGCGIHVACGVAMYPFSDRLIEAVETMPPNEFEEFLAGWREELDTILRTDPLGFIGHKCKAAAREIHSQFPCRDILLAYVQPLTSWSPNFASVVTIPSLHLRQPNLEGLASFCFRRFEWSPADLHAKFEKFIWPGVTLRMLCQPSPRNELPYFRPAAVLGIIRREVRTVQDRTIIVYRGCVQGSSLVTCTESGIKQALDADCDINNMANRDPNSSTVRNVWIPLAVVRDALPLFIKAQDEILDDKFLPPSSNGVDITIFDLSN